MLNTIVFSTTDGGMLVCVKPLKINFNKTTIWQKCKSLCSLRLYFLSSGHPCSLTGQALFRNHVLDVPETMPNTLYFWIYFGLFFYYIWYTHWVQVHAKDERDCTYFLKGYTNKHYFIINIFCCSNVSEISLRDCYNFFYCFCVTDGMLSLGNSQAFIMSLTKTNYS